MNNGNKNPNRFIYNNSLSSTRKRNIKNNKRGNTEKLTIYRTLGRYAPDRLKVNLVFLDTTLTRTVTSSDAMNWSYRSSAYDPDPGAFTGSIPGFVELANLYAQYCVHSMKLDLEVANQNSESVILVAWPSSIGQNVNSLTKADIAEYSGNVRAKSSIVSNSNGMNKSRLVVLASGSQLVGPHFKTDLDYSASTSANPTETYSINIGMANPYGNFTYPMATRAKIIYTVEFYKLRQLDT